MPTIYDLKPAFQKLLRPITRSLAGLGVTANQVTVAAMLLSFAGGLSIALGHHLHWPLLLVPLVLFVRMALNAIDGMLAREHDMKSDLGAMLNEVGDVISDAALYLPMALVTGFSAPLIIGIVCLAIVSEMSGVVGVQIGASRRYDGPMGKSDRAFVFSVLALLAAFGFLPQPWIDLALGVVVILTGLTIINRARLALKEKRALG